MNLEEIIRILLERRIPHEEIIEFLKKEINIDEKTLKRFVSAFAKDNKKAILSYAVMQALEEKEKKYFLNYLRTHNKEESAECFAELAIMLERLMILNSFYIYKIKKLEKRLEEKDVFRKTQRHKQ